MRNGEAEATAVVTVATAAPRSRGAEESGAEVCPCPDM